MAEMERIYTVPFRDAYSASRVVRARVAIKLLRKFLVRHMRVLPENVVISEKLNSFIWSRGMRKPPRKVKIRAKKTEEKVEAYLFEEAAAKVEVKEIKPVAPTAGMPAPQHEAGKMAQPQVVSEHKVVTPAPEEKETPEAKEERPTEKKMEKKPEKPAKEKKGTTRKVKV